MPPAEKADPENGVAAAATVGLDPLTADEVDPDIVNEFADMSDDDDLANEAMHYVKAGEEDARPVLAYRERLGREGVTVSEPDWKRQGFKSEEAWKKEFEDRKRRYEEQENKTGPAPASFPPTEEGQRQWEDARRKFEAGEEWRDGTETRHP